MILRCQMSFPLVFLSFLLLPILGKAGFLPSQKAKYMEYLNKYGYLSTTRMGTLNLDGELGKSVKRLQRFAGLKETGDLSDPQTLALLEKSRCGLPDIGNSRQLAARYAVHGANWKKRELTYKIVNYTPDLSKEKVDQTIATAIAMWASVSSLTFTKITAPDKEADIMIKFVRGYHGDSRPADGPGKELAHAFFPLDNKGLSGDLHFDEDETFTLLDAKEGVDLLWVAVHELGHSLGLDHSYQPDSIMFPFYMGYKPDLKLSEDDISGIKALYGKSTKPVQPSAPDKCHVTLDAMVTLANKKTFVFSGAYLWQVFGSEKNRTVGEAREIRDVFPELEDNIDAAFTQQSHGHTIFFKGAKYWAYANQKYIWGPADIKEMNLPSELQKMDAALEWPRNGKAYFFKGDKYWRYNIARNKIDPGYPRKIRRAWKGVPATGLDDAILWNDGKVYFFKGEGYFYFDHQKVRVRKNYPRSISSDWFGCP